MPEDKDTIVFPWERGLSLIMVTEGGGGESKTKVFTKNGTSVNPIWSRRSLGIQWFLSIT